MRKILYAFRVKNNVMEVRIMSDIIRRAKETISDVSTAGVVSGIILATVNCLPVGMQTLLTLGIPALACTYNFGNRVINERIAKKDKEKIDSLIYELHQEMAKRQLADLSRFLEFDFSPEVYATVEELVREGINAKNRWTRKLVALILVTVGSTEGEMPQGLQRCLSILRELDDLDVRLLTLHTINSLPMAGEDINNSKDELAAVHDQLLLDVDVSAQSIKVSADRLAAFGLIMHGCSLYPYDDEHSKHSNKKEMIADFLAQTRSDITAIFLDFSRFLQHTSD